MDSGLSGLIGALIGAGSAIGVGLINNAHERKLQRKHIHRERLEELHILVGQWSLLHLENYTHVSSLMIGRYTLADFYAIDIEPIPSFDFSRLEMIVGIHGEVLLPSFQAVKDILDDMTSIQMEFVESCENGSPSYEHNQAYALYQSQLTDAVKSFKAAIVKAAKEV